MIDRRGERSRGGGGVSPGMVGLFLQVGSRFGVSGVLVLGGVFVALYVCGGGLGLTGGDVALSPQALQAQQGDVAFVSFVLDDAQATWADVFAARGERYEPAELVLYHRGTSTGCGYGEAAVGPFYCPADQRVYLDLGFFDELGERFGAPGDFAEAYVIAHEIGHHVQHLRGEDDARRGAGATGGSVRLELQADCYAGVWAHATTQRGLVESGDVREALTAASAIGDDTLQRQGTGLVRPDSFTHGTSDQRMRWFRRGLDSGRPEACDTAAVGRL